MNHRIIPIGLGLFFTFLILFFLYILYGYGEISVIITRFTWLIFTSILLFLILHILFCSLEKSLLGVMWFIFTPWVIQQSFSLGGSHYFTLLLLFQVYLYLKTRCRVIIPLGFILLLILGRFVYPEFWIYKSLSLPTFRQFLVNVMNLLSFKLFFFHNSFLGSKNSIGVFYPETIPLIILGIYQALTHHRIRLFLKVLFPWVTIIFITNEDFGGKEIFVLLPFFSIFFVFGLEILYRRMVINTLSVISRILFLTYIIFLFYGLVNFMHYFRVHYLPFEME